MISESANQGSPTRYSKPLIIAAVVIFVLSIICGGAIYVVNKNAAIEKQYADDLNNVVTQMLDNGSAAEKMINGYTNIWGLIIDVECCIEAPQVSKALDISVGDVHKFITPQNENGVYAYQGDIDRALGAAYEYYSNTNMIGSLKNKRDEISETLKKLNTPPDKYKQNYELALGLFKLFDKLVSNAISPSGSLVTYRQTTNTLIDDFVSQYKEYEIKAP